jgi:hypothetical protein
MAEVETCPGEPGKGGRCSEVGREAVLIPTNTVRAWEVPLTEKGARVIGIEILA